MKTAEINAGLKIVKLDGRKMFPTTNGYYSPEGFALYHSELGYYSFKGDCPYTPIGGKKALKAILDGGGFLDFDNCVWLKEMK